MTTPVSELQKINPSNIVELFQLELITAIHGSNTKYYFHNGTNTNENLAGGSTNVVVNVDASGSSVEGDEAQGRQLGQMLSAAIESELIKQKRPGGLLT